MADSSYGPKAYRKQGGNDFVIASGGTLDIESGGALELAGTAITASAAELNTLDGISASTTELNTYVLYVSIPDISTAQSVFVVAPQAGTITGIYTVIHGAITVGDATITAELGGVAVTGSSITIANAGSAAGDVDSSVPTGARSVTAGQAIEIITDGGSTDAVVATVSIALKR